MNACLGEVAFEKLWLGPGIFSTAGRVMEWLGVSAIVGLLDLGAEGHGIVAGVVGNGSAVELCV
jgi:hypothetical protein